MEPTIHIDSRGFVWYDNVRLPFRVVQHGFEFMVRGQRQRERHGQTVVIPRETIVRTAYRARFAEEDKGAMGTAQVDIEE